MLIRLVKKRYVDQNQIVLYFFFMNCYIILFKFIIQYYYNKLVNKKKRGGIIINKGNMCSYEMILFEIIIKKGREK